VKSKVSSTILVVEDEKEIADTLTYALASQGFEPLWVANGDSALSTLNDQAVALCILDVGLPDANGFELLKAIRKLESENRDVPIMFLTARGEEIDRIIGLEIGADDYVCKPFSPREVVARVKVILKRLEKQAEPDQPAELGLFEHRQEQRTIAYEGKSMSLTRAEYELLATFLERPSQVFSRRQLIEKIWSSNHPSDDRAIDTHIKTLRAKLKTQNPHKEFITTHRGFGYSLDL